MFVWFGIAAIIVFIIALYVTGCAVSCIIGWQNYPEAMLIDMALKAVG